MTELVIENLPFISVVGLILILIYVLQKTFKLQNEFSEKLEMALQNVQPPEKVSNDLKEVNLVPHSLPPLAVPYIKPFNAPVISPVAVPKPLATQLQCGVSNQDIGVLLARFPKVTHLTIKTPECTEFIEEVFAKIEMAKEQMGLAGIQTWLTHNCKWGPFGSDRSALCDVSGKLKKIRCTAASSFARLCLSQADCVVKSDRDTREGLLMNASQEGYGERAGERSYKSTPLDDSTGVKTMYVGQCQMLIKVEDTEITMIREFFSEHEKTPEYFLQTSTMYHECIVKILIDEKRAFVWDYGAEYGAPCSATASNAVIAYRFDVDAPFRSVEFDNFTVPVGRWFTTCPEITYPGFVRCLKPILTTRTDLELVDNYGLRLGKCVGQPLFSVFISGNTMNNGNPCPGVGVARSLRRAYGSRVKLIAFDYSIFAGGIKDPVFDEANCIKQFYGKKGMVKEEIIKRIKMVLVTNPNAYFISTFDVEIDVLGAAIVEAQGEEWTTRVLIPTQEILERTEKPCIDIITQHFPMDLPKYMDVTQDTEEEEVQRFCESNGWPLLCKGTRFGCSKIFCHKDVEPIRKSFEKKWGMGMFVQKPCFGYEKSYCFSAYQGKLLGAVEMRKDLATKEGKCWGVHLEELTAETTKCLERMCAASKWTGGGEIEFMEGLDGQKYIIDFNPRFPAWIFGSCHGGINLVGLLMQEITGIVTDDVTSPVLGGDFIRTVLEVPVDNQTVQPLLLTCPGSFNCSINSKGKGSVTVHPSRFGEIAALTLDDSDDSDFESEDEATSATVDDEDTWVLDVNKFDSTPQYMLHEATLCKTIDTITNFTKSLDIETMIGLSVKTQPHNLILRCAKQAGWKAECISQAEVQKSLDAGFPSSEIIVNGPLKNWPGKLPTDGLKAWFADSFEDYDELIESTPAEYVGFRLAPHQIPTRFGVPIEQWREIKERLDKLDESQKIGLHFHFAQSKLGSTGWFGMARGVIRMMAMICPRVELMDMGGGWNANTMVRHGEEMASLIAFAKERLPNLSLLCFEPGKSVSQTAGGFLTEVQMFRSSTGQQRNLKKENTFKGKGVVVDGMIGDFGVFGMHKHPLFYYSSIEVLDDSINVRAGQETDVEYLAESLKIAQPWARNFDNEKLNKCLTDEVCHYSKWLVAEIAGSPVGAVFSFHNSETPGFLVEESETDTDNILVQMVSEVTKSGRKGCHCACLTADGDGKTKLSIAHSLMHVVINQGLSELDDNNCYFIQTTQENPKGANHFGFTFVEEYTGDYSLLQRKFWKPLQDGKDKILGRICMEFDQFGDITIPEDLKVGDYILIRDCGAYDMTMSYLFGDAKERNIRVV